jgi:hypothetical protein
LVDGWYDVRRVFLYPVYVREKEDIMKYFRVPVRMDGKRVFRKLVDGSFERTFTPVRELVRNELYTGTELNTLGLEYLKDSLECIEMSRKKVYWCFGARFAV